MRIRIAILDLDENYKKRLLSNFQIKYADKMELYTFSRKEHLYNYMENANVDVVLVDESIELDEKILAAGTVLIYLCKTMDIEELNGLPAVCKFQRIDIIYKEILGIYAERTANMKLKRKGSSARLLLFLSAQGGSGVSSAAAAYALRCAQNGKNVFYLNLELLGGSNLYFTNDGIMSFSDVIYALKSKKSNLMIKMESSIKTDRSGVDFFDSCKNAYDMAELNDEELGLLLQGIMQIKDYEEIVIDISGSLDARMQMLMKDYAEKIICVSDGSRTGNQKFVHFCEILGVMDQRNETNLLGKMVLLYNRYGSKTSTQLEQSPLPVLGGIHRYTCDTERELIEEISKLQILDQI